MLSGRLAELREDDLDEHLVLFQDLIGIEALFMSEGTEFHRFGRDRGGGIELLFRVLEESGDPVDQERYVIQQLVARENLVVFEGDAGADSLEPAGNDVIPPRAKLFGEKFPQGSGGLS